MIKLHSNIKITLHYHCSNPKCKYPAACCTNPDTHATPSELAKYMFCLAHGQQTGKKLLIINTTISQLARTAGGMIPWLNSDSAHKPVFRDEPRPDHGIVCSKYGCEKWARKNLPVSPHTISIQNFEDRCLCYGHARATHQTTFDIEYTLDKIGATFLSKGDFWEVWEDRDKANAEKPTEARDGNHSSSSMETRRPRRGKKA